MADPTPRLDCAAAYDKLPGDVQRRLGIAALVHGLSSPEMWGNSAREAAGLAAAQAISDVLEEHVLASREGPIPLPDLAALDVQACRECGCTDDHACPNGCSWVEPDLCSTCAEEAATAPQPGTLAHWERQAFMFGHPGEAKVPYQDRITAELQAVADKECQQLLLMAPCGITTAVMQVAELFPIWAAAARSRLRVLVVGNSSMGVRIFTRGSWIADPYVTVERNSAYLGVELVPSARLNMLQLSNNSTIRYTSLFAAQTGFGYDLAIVCDPLGVQDVETKEKRDLVWRAFQENVLSRQNLPGGCPIIVLGEPRHPDDLISRLRGDPGWRKVHMPAIAAEGDQLGRAPGEPLIPRFVQEDYLRTNRLNQAWLTMPEPVRQRDAFLHLEPFLPAEP